MAVKQRDAQIWCSLAREEKEVRFVSVYEQRISMCRYRCWRMPLGFHNWVSHEVGAYHSPAPAHRDSSKKSRKQFKKPTRVQPHPACMASHEAKYPARKWKECAMSTSTKSLSTISFDLKENFSQVGRLAGQCGQSVSTSVLQARQVLKIFHNRSDKATT